MRRIVLCALAPLLLGAPAASAAGLNLGWNDCPSGAAYSLLETFACDTNFGVHTLVGSFVAPAGINAMSGNEIVIDIQTGGASLPAWWTFGAGQCRPSFALTVNFDFTSGPSTCTDYWLGSAAGGIGWSVLPSATNRCRIQVVVALPVDSPGITPLTEGVEYYSFKANIRNNQTTGLGACAGCSEEACIVFNVLRISQPAPNPPQTILINPAVTEHLVWQGWSTTDPNNQCPAVTPARQQTWGSIKALYR
jgi:hypothetical protein